MAYQYVTYNEKGEVVRGRVAGEATLGEFSLPMESEGTGLKSLVSSLHLERLFSRGRRVKPTEIVLFYRQMALLLESGIDIITSLGLLRSQSASHALNRVLGEVISDLQAGSQLSTAMAKHPQIFPPICYQSLKVGEHTGNLEVMLRQIADYVEKSAVTSKNLKNALMYPIITAFVAFGVIIILVTVVLPAFSSLYTQLGTDLPMMTKILLSASGALQKFGIYIILSLIIAFALGMVYIKTPPGRYKWDRLMLRLPMMGRVNHLNELARCCRSISLLFRAGLPLTESLPLVTQVSRNKVMIEALENVNEDMLRGEGLSRPMAKNPIFMPMMVQMVKVGEETGNLDVTLLSVAQNYEAEAEDRTRTLIGLIQPAMTVIIGLVVGLIAVSLISAMYSMYGQVG